MAGRDSRIKKCAVSSMFRLVRSSQGNQERPVPVTTAAKSCQFEPCPLVVEKTQKRSGPATSLRRCQRYIHVQSCQQRWGHPCQGLSSISWIGLQGQVRSTQLLSTQHGLRLGRLIRVKHPHPMAPGFRTCYCAASAFYSGPSPVLFLVVTCSRWS